MSYLPPESDPRIVRYAAWGMAGAVLVAATVAAVMDGGATAILVLAGGALIGAIATLWASLRALLGELPMSAEDAYALARNIGEEEQKRAVLRTLDDLDFELFFEKITTEDHAAAKTRYRAEAKRLLQSPTVRAGDQRRAEELMAKRLASDPAAATDDQRRADAPVERADDASTKENGPTR